MFSDHKKTKAPENLAPQNRIAPETTIVGDLIGNCGYRIDGKVQGTIKTKGKVVVGKSGFIEGTLEGTNADFEGQFSGVLKLTGTLTLRSTAQIDGEVEVGKLAVDPGATFNATCNMKGAIKSLNKSETKPKGAPKNKEQTA